MGYGLTLTETLLDQLGDQAPVQLRAGDWEIGRLVLAPAYRSDVDALRHCLRLALEYVREQEHIGRLFAACTHVLSRLYRRFAFQAFAREVPLHGTAKTYTLISGCAEEVRRTIAERPAARTQ
jgi:hypothetical protein